jgi:hypothetical protein
MDSKPSAEGIRKKLAQRARSHASNPWRHAAAVLLHCDLRTLLPLVETDSGAPAGSALDIAPDCIAFRPPTPATTTDPLQPVWTLREQVRLTCLGELYRTHRVEAALRTNPQELKRPANRLFEHLLLGRPFEVSAVPLDQLGSCLEGARLLRRISGAPVTEALIAAIERRFVRESLLESFAHLTRGFVGRRQELRTLRSHVDALDAEWPTEALVRFVRRHLPESPPRALVVHGLGGVGKSSLLARFILDHFDDEKLPLAFVYFDMERGELTQCRPAALLDAAFEQLAAFKPLLAERFELERRNIDSEISPEQAAERLGLALLELGSNAPVLLVFDTFEVFQRSGNLVERLSRFLTSLQGVLPNFKVVICGRAPAPDVMIHGKPPAHLHLEGLDGDAAIERICQAGIGRDAAAKVVANVGTNPLSLTLALRLLEKDPRADLNVQKWFSSLRDIEIQGVLYKRFVDRIEDEQVKRVAHPGLMVRRVDPDVLLRVLNAPCELGLTTKTQAEDLMSRLQREGSLITVDDDGALRFRAELRAAAVPLLEHDDRQLTQAIHREAIGYYARRQRPLEKAEFVYHSLAVGDLASAEAAWTPALEMRLGVELELLPEASQQWWRARTASLERVEGQKFAEHMLEERDFAGVLELSARHGDVRLVQLRALALLGLGHEEEARVLAREALGHSVSDRAKRDWLQAIARDPLPRERYAEPSPGARQHLAHLLASAFPERSLARFLHSFDDKRVASTAGMAPPLVVEILGENGAVDASFFARLRGNMPRGGEAVDEAEEYWIGERWSKLTHTIRHQTAIELHDELEKHGPWLVSRGRHLIPPLSEFRMGIYPVVNEMFLDFVRAGGYENRRYWSISTSLVSEFTCRDGSPGPASWPGDSRPEAGLERHPVAGICFWEAQAFVAWLRDTERSEAGWTWSLPADDMWELTARTVGGYAYPWGPEFDSTRCNCAERGLKQTTPAGAHESGRSLLGGCHDMTGNVWEFVLDNLANPGGTERATCILRGGGFNNNASELKASLRLFGVPRTHRALDFGMRCALVKETNR